jgi:hypothetical protein
MSNNIVDLSNLDSWDLIKELNKRGYYTNLIFGISDIDSQLESINGNRDEEDGNIIVLSDDDKIEILQSTAINTDWYCERMNESLEEHILDYYDDEAYYKKVDNVEENS